jgi:hypothetical protein
LSFKIASTASTSNTNWATVSLRLPSK